MYHKLPVSVNLSLFKDNLLLLSKRNGQDGGAWSLVAGRMEEGESPSLAMIREVGEEINIDIKPENLSAVLIMYGKFPEYMGVFLNAQIGLES